MSYLNVNDQPQRYFSFQAGTKVTPFIPSAPQQIFRKDSGRANNEDFFSDESASTDASAYESPNKQHQHEASLKRPKRNFATQQDRRTFVKEYKRKQKTELCKNWEEYGSCKWGGNCSYAHGQHELMKKTHLPLNFMTKACDQYHGDKKFCAYGKRCQYMHSERDIFAPQAYSTILRENTRLAKAKMEKVDIDERNLQQVYINVFTCKPRLSCFANIVDDEPANVDSNSDIKTEVNSAGSDPQSRLFEDFIDMKVQKKTKSGKVKKKKFVLDKTASKDQAPEQKAPKNFHTQFNKNQQMEQKFKMKDCHQEFFGANSNRQNIQTAPVLFVPTCQA